MEIGESSPVDVRKVREGVMGRERERVGRAQPRARLRHEFGGALRVAEGEGGAVGVGAVEGEDSDEVEKLGVACGLGLGAEAEALGAEAEALGAEAEAEAEAKKAEEEAEAEGLAGVRERIDEGVAAAEQVASEVRPRKGQDEQAQGMGAPAADGQKLPMGQMTAVALVEPAGQ